MKTVSLAVGLLAVLLSVSAVAGTDSASAASSTPAMCDQLKQGGASSEMLAQSGCCSWHGGVCGCAGGRVQCCDGRTSPSCLCNQKDASPTVPN